MIDIGKSVSTVDVSERMVGVGVGVLVGFDVSIEIGKLSELFWDGDVTTFVNCVMK